VDRATFDRPDPPTETELLSLRLEGLDCETGYNRNTGEEPTEKPGDDLSLEAALGDLALLVNDLNYHTDLLNIYAHSGDFGSLVSQPVGQGTFFQVRKVDGIDKQMVAKVPRTDLIGNDRTANSATTLASIKSELETLCHEPVRRHPNVVDILGLGWARLESTTDLAIPVLFLEFATYGTLAQYLETKLGPEKRLGIASDVTKGLQVLHACGIIHGDLKLENVLVFQDGNGSAIAKLADFGSSYPLKDRDFPPKGRSPLWAAPEWDRRIEPDELHKTDIYSLGLLIWRLCLEGANPFYGMDSGNVDERKRKDLVLFDAKKSIEDYYDFTKSWQFNLSDAELFDMYVFCVILPKSAFNYSLCLDPKMRHLGGVLASLSLEKYYG
jgi:serine/threonine protein kinase